MLKLATILNNPGEPKVESRYNDPRQLKELGYNGLVIYSTTGLSGVASAEAIADSEVRYFVEQQIEEVRSKVADAREAGLDVYITYDVLSLVREQVEANVLQVSCKNRPEMLCPGAEVALDYSASALKSLLQQIGDVQGVVLRFGDNDAARLPHLVGNDIYQPHCGRCSHLGRADRIVLVLKKFHKLVVGELGKRLIARAWNVRPNGLHDSVDLCRRVHERLPSETDSDQLILSFKFTQTDFWRYQPFNPSSLSCGRRPILIELQCQREFEGKGGIPNWQVPLWRDGGAEISPVIDGDQLDCGGLADAAKRINFAGLWAWVRGGGWGGPFVGTEKWIDANVFAVPRLADDPGASAEDLAGEWIEKRLGISDEAVVAVLKEVLTHSPNAVLNSFYIGPYARSRREAWHPNAGWIQDDLVDAQAAWRIIQRLPDAVLDEVVAEKQRAVEQVSHGRAALQGVVNENNQKVLGDLVNTLIYAESLFEAMRDLFIGLVAYRRYSRGKDKATGDLARQKLAEAQGHWNNHTQRHGSLAGTATSFRETNFWDLTQGLLGELG